MTIIDKPTIRRSRFDFASYGIDKRPVVVTIEPVGSEGDFITLKLLRRRESLRIDVNDLMRLLIRQKALSAHMKKIGKRRKVMRKHARLTS